MFSSLLDRLYRHPFEGRSARRYARDERPAFGDLDDRLLDELALPQTGRLLDLGAGPGTFTRRVRARFPDLTVVAVDPSHDWPSDVIAAGEALPFADRAFDMAMCLSSIRHVRDRAVVLAELRRVAARLVIVELDPAASSTRIAAHADLLGSSLLRIAFGPLVVKTAPSATQIEAIARAAGWTRRSLRDDAVQPVYILELE